MTAEQAQMIMEAHEIEQTLDNNEEAELLLHNDPDLYEAYIALRNLAQA
jgi:hypothetical protein